MKNGLLVITCAMALLTGCPSDPVTPGTDGGMTGTDAPARVRPALTVGNTTTNMPANLDCPDRAEPAAGTAMSRDFRLISRGLSTADIYNGAFEIWPSNVVGDTCAAPDCIALTSGADAGSILVSADVDDTFYAYRVPANAVAMTYPALGYNFLPDADGENEITTIPVGIFMTAITLIRSGMMADPADGILTGDVSDCDGRGMRGVTTRLFAADGTEITPGAAGPNDFGQAYRAMGSLPDDRLPETDYSGGYAAANIPIVAADPRVAVVAYGTTTEGGEVDVIACEEVTVSTGAITILSMGPYRADYGTGNLCLQHAPTP